MNNYLTIRQACELLQVCRDTLVAMITDGRIRALNLKRPGGKYDIWRVDLTGLQPELSAAAQAEKLKLRDIERRMRI